MTNPMTYLRAFLGRFHTRDLGHFVAAFAAAFLSTLAVTAAPITATLLIGAAAGAASVAFRQVFPSLLPGDVQKIVLDQVAKFMDDAAKFRGEARDTLPVIPAPITPEPDMPLAPVVPLPTTQAVVVPDIPQPVIVPAGPVQVVTPTPPISPPNLTVVPGEGVDQALKDALDRLKSTIEDPTPGT